MQESSLSSINNRASNKNQSAFSSDTISNENALLADIDSLERQLGHVKTEKEKLLAAHRVAISQHVKDNSSLRTSVTRLKRDADDFKKALIEKEHSLQKSLVRLSAAQAEVRRLRFESRQNEEKYLATLRNEKVGSLKYGFDEFMSLRQNCDSLRQELHKEKTSRTHEKIATLRELEEAVSRNKILEKTIADVQMQLEYQKTRSLGLEADKETLRATLSDKDSLIASAQSAKVEAKMEAQSWEKKAGLLQMQLDDSRSDADALEEKLRARIEQLVSCHRDTRVTMAELQTGLTQLGIASGDEVRSAHGQLSRTKDRLDALVEQHDDLLRASVEQEDAIRQSSEIVAVLSRKVSSLAGFVGEPDHSAQPPDSPVRALEQHLVQFSTKNNQGDESFTFTCTASAGDGSSSEALNEKLAELEAKYEEEKTMREEIQSDMLADTMAMSAQLMTMEKRLTTLVQENEALRLENIRLQEEHIALLDTHALGQNHGPGGASQRGWDGALNSSGYLASPDEKETSRREQREVLTTPLLSICKPGNNIDFIDQSVGRAIRATTDAAHGDSVGADLDLSTEMDQLFDGEAVVVHKLDQFVRTLSDEIRIRRTRESNTDDSCPITITAQVDAEKLLRLTEKLNAATASMSPVFGTISVEYQKEIDALQSNLAQRIEDTNRLNEEVIMLRSRISSSTLSGVDHVSSQAVRGFSSNQFGSDVSGASPRSMAVEQQQQQAEEEESRRRADEVTALKQQLARTLQELDAVRQSKNILLPGTLCAPTGLIAAHTSASMSDASSSLPPTAGFSTSTVHTAALSQILGEGERERRGRDEQAEKRQAQELAVAMAQISSLQRQLELVQRENESLRTQLMESQIAQKQAIQRARQATDSEAALTEIVKREKSKNEDARDAMIDAKGFERQNERLRYELARAQKALSEVERERASQRDTRGKASGQSKHEIDSDSRDEIQQSAARKEKIREQLEAALSRVNELEALIAATKEDKNTVLGGAGGASSVDVQDVDDEECNRSQDGQKLATNNMSSSQRKTLIQHHHQLESQLNVSEARVAALQRQISSMPPSLQVSHAEKRAVESRLQHAIEVHAVQMKHAKQEAEKTQAELEAFLIIQSEEKRVLQERLKAQAHTVHQLTHHLQVIQARQGEILERDHADREKLALEALTAASLPPAPWEFTQRTTRPNRPRGVTVSMARTNRSHNAESWLGTHVGDISDGISGMGGAVGGVDPESEASLPATTTASTPAASTVSSVVCHTSDNIVDFTTAQDFRDTDNMTGTDMTGRARVSGLYPPRATVHTNAAAVSSSSSSSTGPGTILFKCRDHSVSSGRSMDPPAPPHLPPSGTVRPSPVSASASSWDSDRTRLPVYFKQQQQERILMSQQSQQQRNNFLTPKIGALYEPPPSPTYSVKQNEVELLKLERILRAHSDAM